jgi:UrcA family protein
MSKRLITVAVALLAGVSVNAVVIAQEMGEVTVQASRVVKKVIGRTSSGVPIEDISLSYGVSTTGLDLSSSAGAAELKKRVTEAANTACKELGRQYPEATTTDAECVKNATDKAMVKVNDLIAAAKKGK